jgi:glutathione S-transferase
MILHNYDLFEDCYRVRLLAALTGQTLELRNVDAFPGFEQTSDKYLALNPLGRLPILEDGELILRDVMAILLYVVGQDGEARYLPKDPKTHAQMLDWLGFACHDLAVANTARAVSLLDLPGDGPAAQAEARKLLRILDDHLTKQALTGAGYVAGTAPTLADIALFPSFALSRDFGIDHDEFPALRLWARRMRALDGFITMPGIPDYH